MKRIIGFITCSIFLLLTAPAFAVFGEFDSQNKYPFVVLLKHDGGECTGVVHDYRLVFTAAHCLWANGAFVKNLVILFKDENGMQRSVMARKLYVPDSYKKITARMKRTSNPHTGTTFASDNLNDYRAFNEQDIGIILPDEDVRAGHYGRSIYDAFPAKEVAHDLDQTGGKFNDAILAKYYSGLAAFLGNQDTSLKVRGIVVGYGIYYCENYDDLTTCKRDRLRRFSKVRFVIRPPEPYRVPWVWSFKKSEIEPEPSALAGDSGGPFFIATPDGRWLLAGFISGSWGDYSIASSLVTHVKFFYDFLNSSDHLTALAEGGARPSGLATSPSFSCSKVTTPDEIAICSNNELAELDLRVSKLFRHVRDDVNADAAREAASVYLRGRRACLDNVTCIKRILSNEISVFNKIIRIGRYEPLLAGDPD
jgi:hypothetical protein